MAILNATERFACEELALARGNSFEIAYRFMPSKEMERVLALEALFCALRDIPHRVAEPTVGRAKLSFWAAELAEMKERRSRHPIGSALQRCGVVDNLDSDVLQAYIDAVAGELREDSIRDLRHLESIALRPAGYETLLMTGLGSRAKHSTALAACGMALRLMELCQDLGPSQTDMSWLPMDLRAEFQIDRSEYDPAAAQHRKACLLSRLAEYALSVMDRATVDWRGLRHAGADLAGLRLVYIRSAIVRRRLQRMGAHPVGVLEGRTGARVGDVVAAWNRARKFSVKYDTRI